MLGSQLSIHWLLPRGRCSLVVRLLAFHLGEPSSIPFGAAPGRQLAGIVSDDATCQRVFSGISGFHRPCIPLLLHTHLASPSLALKTSFLSVVQNSPLHSIGRCHAEILLYFYLHVVAPQDVLVVIGRNTFNFPSPGSTVPDAGTKNVQQCASAPGPRARWEGKKLHVEWRNSSDTLQLPCAGFSCSAQLKHDSSRRAAQSATWIYAVHSKVKNCIGYIGSPMPAPKEPWFYLWGHLKAMCATLVDDVDTLRERILAGCGTIRNTPGIHQCVRESIQRRVEACVSADKGHYKHFL
ncbi:hypothetical protein PR048_028504 [Dryococelus australis]|uniref:Uncharacterized protein n=1 Tax=Dryococelus australis TaxID=614101 RepID=A0ABQ9GAS2_9NEOP|nr:hypothetical protein PR048_028504 [Dryococelus australis]